MADTVVLRVGNRDYAGWETMKLARSIEALAGSFSLTVVDRWAGQRKPWPIREGDECSVIVNDGNSRYYEGAPGRTWSTGLNLAYSF